MVNCPACDKWFASEFHMKGHLRLSNDYRHVAYTGKKISRKPKHKLSEKPLKQTDSALWEVLSRVEAKLEELNKTQQQPAMKTETPIASLNPPRPSDNELLERITRLETKFDLLNKSQQQSVTKTENPMIADSSKKTEDLIHELWLEVKAKNNPRLKPPQQVVINTEIPVVPQLKKMNWWKYAGIDRALKRQDPFAPSDEYLNSLVESGYSPEYVRDRALGKYYKSIYDDDED